MCMLPEDILNNIMFFNSHPIADVLNESSIFKYRELRGIITNLPSYAQRDIATFSVECACADAYNGYHILSTSVIQKCRQLADEELLKQVVINYNIGYMHTIMKEDDNADDIEDNEYPYTFKVSNIIPELCMPIEDVVRYALAANDYYNDDDSDIGSNSDA